MWLVRWWKSRSEKVGKRNEVAVANFGRVDDGIYRGAAPDFAAYAHLADFGIRTIIDLRAGDRSEDIRTAQAAGIYGFQAIPMSDKAAPNPKSIERALELLTAGPGARVKPVYVHCAGGRHRTGLVIACFRVRHCGWSKERAWKEAEAYGFYSAFGHSPLKKYFFEEFK